MLQKLQGKKVVLFGAGKNGKKVLDKLVENGITPAYFIDNNPNVKFVEYENNTGWERLCVKSSDALMTEDKHNLKIIITPIGSIYEEIEAQIRKMGFEICIFLYIINNDVKKMLYCDRIYSNLVFRGWCISFCCEQSYGYKKSPEFPYHDSGEATMKNFLKQREKIIKEELNTGELCIAKSCEGCIRLRKSEKPLEVNKINFINIGTYPAPCQCKCVYCSIFGKNGNKTLKSEMEVAKKSNLIKIASESISFLQQHNYISQDPFFTMGSGEITIHPYKKHIYDVVGDYSALWFSNGFVYDQRIADNIRKNKNSKIFVSIDAGTQKTYHTIKGVNKFDAVLANLASYKKSGNVLLKYIILPGVNDSEADLNGFAKVCCNLGITKVQLSWDYHVKGGLNDNILKSTASLVKKLEDVAVEPIIINEFGEANVFKIKNFIEQIF